MTQQKYVVGIHLYVYLSHTPTRLQIVTLTLAVAIFDFVHKCFTSILILLASYRHTLSNFEILYLCTF